MSYFRIAVAPVVWIVSLLAACACVNGAAIHVPMRSLTCGYPIKAMQLHTRGNRLLDAAGGTVVVHGVDLPSMEWTNRGEHIRRSLAAAIKQWHIRIVRIPTADARWFGQMPGQKHGGRVYRHILDQLISTAAENHVYVVFDLHWTDMGGHTDALGQHRMPGPGSLIFWRSAAERYKHFPNVLFDVYNEPHGIPWTMWRNGGPCAGETRRTVVAYPAAGMQQLYDTVRKTGAENIVIVGGLSWAYNDFGIPHGFAIRGHNVVYDCHVYPWKNKWRRNFETEAKSEPLIIDEFGGGAKDVAFGKKVLAFASKNNVSWCAWSFHPKAGPVLITNWRYQPSIFGRLIKRALAGK